MINGIKLTYFRIIYYIFVIIGVMPVWYLIQAYYVAWAGGFTHAIIGGDAVPILTIAINLIPMGMYIGVACAIGQTYFGATKDRQFENTYLSGTTADPYLR